MKTRSFCRALAAIGLLSALARTQAATITVTSLSDSGAGSLRQAIQDANAGDTIQVNLSGFINLTSGGLTIDKSLNIYGPRRTLTITRSPSGAPNFRIFTITSGTVDIRGFTISNGRCASNEFGGGGNTYVAAAANLFGFYAISGNDASGNSGGGIFS